MTNKFYIFIFSFLLLFNGCSKEGDKELKISVSNWIGYTPLIYAYESGNLKDINIKIIPTSSLSSSLEFMRRDVVDGFCATQREYEFVQDRVSPAILLDKSNGGDKILSNIPKDELYSNKYQNIDVHLEYNSINYTLFQYFKNRVEFINTNFNIINNTQNYITKLNITKPSIIVSYEPYSTMLEKNGFDVIETTKDNSDLLIIDAIFISNDKIKANKNRLKKLKIEIDKAIQKLKENPKEYYSKIYKYLDGQTYEEFLSTLDDIKWINKNNKIYIKSLNNKNIDTKSIL
jgi:NitT/TauT family transport system substrate-binding protein